LESKKEIAAWVNEKKENKDMGRCQKLPPIYRVGKNTPL
jgi:hypothetical protein